MPVGSCHEGSPAGLSRSATLFPVVGAAIGLFSWVAYRGGSWLVSTWVAAAFAIVTEAVLTGAMHLDGLCDTFDGLGLRGSRTEVLAVMKDSRTGAMGAAALGLHLLTKWSLVASIPPPMALGALVAAGSVSRWCSVWCMYAYPYARPEGGLGKPFSKTISLAGLLEALVLCCGCLAVAAVIVAVAAAVVPAMIYPSLAGGSVVGVLCGMILGRLVAGKIGGMTGDVYGAVIEISSSGTLLGVAAVIKVLSSVVG